MKRLRIVLTLLVMPGILSAFSGMWCFNTFLYLSFWGGQQTGDYTIYNRWKDAGAPCYGWHSDDGAGPDSPQPACWYDSSNTNSGG